MIDEEKLKMMYEKIYDYEKSIEYQNVSGQEMELIKLMKETVGSDVPIKEFAKWSVK